MEKFDGALRPGHEGIVDFVLRQHCAHRHRAARQSFGGRHQVGGDAESAGAEGVARSAKTTDNLVEYQQDAMLVTNIPNALQVSLWRNQHACRTRNRLDDDCSNRRGIVQRHDVFEFICQVGTPLRLSFGIRILLDVVRVGQVIDTGQHGAEHFAVR